ncbi:hypothetical protein MKX03_036917, partial [Papaver bracteatum]
MFHVDGDDVEIIQNGYAYAADGNVYFSEVENDFALWKGLHPYDKRRSVSKYVPLFAAIDFSLIESDEDTWWKTDVREPNEGVIARGIEFLN